MPSIINRILILFLVAILGLQVVSACLAGKQNTDGGISLYDQNENAGDSEKNSKEKETKTEKSNYENEWFHTLHLFQFATCLSSGTEHDFIAIYESVPISSVTPPPELHS